MVAVIEGIRIDSDIFPLTFRTRVKIQYTARKFGYPAQDALQDSMLLEHRTRVHAPHKTICGAYLVRALVNECLNRYNANKGIRTQSITDDQGTDIMDQLITYSPAELYRKLYVNELLRIVRGVSLLYHEMMLLKLAHADMSWQKIYQRYYRTKIGRVMFYNRVATMRSTCRKLHSDTLAMIQDAIRKHGEQL